MELRHLRYFVAVAEELHFSRAAVRLHMSQPPLSQQIQALEQELGVQLFERRRSGVTLTEAGHNFLRQVYVVLEQAERAVSVAQRAGRGEVGVLEVGFTGSMPFSEVMPRVLHDFRAAHPGVQLHLRELTSRDQIENLAADKLDVGFIRPTRHDQIVALHTRMLLSEPLVVALHASHPLAQQKRLTLAMLADEPFIVYSRWLGSGLHQQVLSLCLKAGFSPRIVQEVHEMPTIIGLVSAGIGVGLVAASMQRAQVPYVAFRSIDDEAATSDVLLAWRRGNSSPMVANFVNVAMSAVKAGTVAQAPARIHARRP